MVNEIRVYIEGGDNADSRRRLRNGFADFFRSLRALAQGQGIPFRLLPSGSRNETFNDFQTARRTYPLAWSLLLVDSEDLVTPGHNPRQHLETRDGWELLDVNVDDLHLMAQVMETWFCADPEALALYYGQHFNAGALPTRNNLEEEAKLQIEAKLEAATRHTQKGAYRKNRHDHDLLQKISSDKVQTRAPHCRRFFETITRKLRPPESLPPLPV